ncbi:DUF1217 domain-containing protein [Aestuariivirga sp.]|uniref:DUF1217 domain-containing protein n=1 Tax=Aestuariivirga sp. TaxID=2650926 RepID=UPI0025BC5BF7|nr:DUF1217 domain-containing protein [Aestuariivirga sp.]MCA3554227.1 DUF1217 domain-containing protein [Aestuariivirga sp.]
MFGTVARFQQIARNIDKTLGALSQRPDVKREADYYLANIRRVKSADEFLRNDRLYNFAMTAFGLKDMIYGKAFMRKVLTEGVDDQKSFALQLADPRFRDFAETFNFARYGGTATAFERAQQGTVDRFLRIQLEADAGRSDEGVKLALYFQRKAPDAKSVYGLMGDPALYKVVQTALGLPAAYSNTDIDKQAAFISAKINVEDFKDPVKLDNFLTRFAARWQAANGVPGATVPQVGLARPTLASFDNSLLLSMQTLRGYGR